MANYLSEIELPNGNSYELKDKNVNVFFGTCPTAAATEAKVVTLTNGDSFELKAGAIVGVKFTYTNTASNVTINVNNTGAKSIWYNNAVYTSNASGITGYANRISYFMYDGTYWCLIHNGINNSNTTYAVCSTSANGLAPKITNTSGYLKGDGTWTVPPNDNTTYANATTAAAGLLRQLNGSTSNYLRGDGTWATPPDNNTTYGTVSTSANGLAPKVTSTSGFLKGDGTWATPTNTTYSTVTTSHDGLAPQLDGTTYHYLRGDGEWGRPVSDQGLTLIPYSGSSIADEIYYDGSASQSISVASSNAITNISRSGVTFTATRANGSTFTFTQQDNNTTYAVASSTANGLLSTANFLRVAELSLNVIPLNWASTFTHTAYEQNGLYIYGQVGIVMLNFTSTIDNTSEMTIGTFNGSYGAPKYTTSINVPPNTSSTIANPYIKVKTDKTVVIGNYRGNIHKGVRALFPISVITKYGAT